MYPQHTRVMMGDAYAVAAQWSLHLLWYDDCVKLYGEYGAWTNALSFWDADNTSRIH